MADEPRHDDALDAFLKQQRPDEQGAQQFVDKLRATQPQESVAKQEFNRRRAMRLGLGGTLLLIAIVLFRALLLAARRLER